MMCVFGNCNWFSFKQRNRTLKRLYGLNCRTSSTTYCEKKGWFRASVAVKRCFESTTSIREI